MAEDAQDRLAYRGRIFDIEWYCDSSGFSQARDFAEALDDAEKRKLALLFAALGDLGKIQNKEKFRHEGDRIFAFKPKPHRFLAFFFEGGKVIVTNAFTKKQDKLPPREKDKALNRKKDYEKRVIAGTYYDEI